MVRTGRSFANAAFVVLLCALAALLDVPPARGQVTEGECAGEPVTLAGTPQADEIQGTEERDVIDAGDGDDVILALGGDDVVCGGAGNDTISGDAGDDVLRGNDGNDTMRGGTGDDFMQGDFREHTGPGGDDELYGEDGADQLAGGPGTNLLDGGGVAFPGTVDHNQTDFAIYLLAETPVTVDLGEGFAQGDWGSDRLVSIEDVNGGLADDVLIGDGGVNTLIGNGGSDQLFGMGGLDLLLGDGLVALLAEFGHVPGSDVLVGGDGVDVAAYQGSAAAVYADLGTGQVEDGDHVDELRSVEGVGGTDFADLLVGDAGTNYLLGGGGDDTILGAGGGDTISGGFGNDALAGGEGIDLVYFDEAPVTVDTAAGTATSLAGDDEIAEFEGVQGSPFDDVILGGAGDDYLFTGPGNDTLDGRGGLDLVSFFASPGPVQGSFADGLFTTFMPDGTTETDNLVNVEGVEGSPYDDVFTGSGASEFISGAGGGDRLRGGGGHDWFSGDSLSLDGSAPTVHDDVIVGGGGRMDLLSYALAQGPVDVDLRRNTAAGQGSDTIRGVEAVRATPFDDVLEGDGRANILAGLGGADRLVGRGGPDQLIGGQGRDSLRGGSARDVCVGGVGAGGCEETARPRGHPLGGVFAEWERHRFRRRLRYLSRINR